MSPKRRRRPRPIAEQEWSPPRVRGLEPVEIEIDLHGHVEEAEAAGSASIQLDGLFIDYPIVYKAQRILDAARRIQRRDNNP